MSTSLPVTESPEGNVAPKGFPKHWIVLGLLVSAHAAFGAYFNPIGYGGAEFEKIRVFFLTGALLSQPVLFAIWASFAHQRFYHRFLWALLLCTLVSFAEELGSLLLGNDRNHGMLMVIDTTLFLTATVILSVFRHFSRWQIKQPDKEDAPSVYEAYHFGIKHLLILTTITALGCGLFRTLFIINSDTKFLPSIVLFVGVACLYFALIFPVAVIPWYILANSRRPLSQIFYSVTLLGLVDLAAYFIMLLVDSSRPRTPVEIIKVFLFVQLGAIISAVASTLVLRWCGFRMIREPRIQNQT